MKLRKECEHGRYDGHACKDGKYWSQVKMLQASKYPAAIFTVCPGGVFLPDDTLVIEKVDGEWPKGTAEFFLTDDDGLKRRFLGIDLEEFQRLAALSVRETE